MRKILPRKEVTNFTTLSRLVFNAASTQPPQQIKAVMNREARKRKSSPPQGKWCSWLAFSDSFGNIRDFVWDRPSWFPRRASIPPDKPRRTHRWIWMPGVKDNDWDGYERSWVARVIIVLHKSRKRSERSSHAQSFGTSWYRDISTGPLARSLTRSRARGTVEYFCPIFEMSWITVAWLFSVGHFLTWMRRSVSSTDRPTGKSLMVIWRKFCDEWRSKWVKFHK